MFDTHGHLNFKSFKKNLDGIISEALESGVDQIVIPGTDVPSSLRAVEIAHTQKTFYAAVGIHPHHAFKLKTGSGVSQIEEELTKIEELLTDEKVVAVGEVGMDRHEYRETKYQEYEIDEQFMEVQKQIFEAQVKLAIKYKQSLIIHNREAKDVLLPMLESAWDPCLAGRSVFHCCEPDAELLDFAKKNHMYLGVDGDITYREDKQAFIKTIPLEMLVVETDSPFLLPEPLRTEKKYPNKPSNIPLIIAFIAGIMGKDKEELAEITTSNAKKLFGLSTKTED